MAYNKIQFNNSTITLSGVKWNGSLIEGCRGVKLNGEVVVDFGSLNWSDYASLYNGVWTEENDVSEMTKIAAENEFAIVRSRWL